jgi:hypothetical protein
VYSCGGYNLIIEVRECFKLNLSDLGQGWVESAPMLKGRFNHKLVAAGGKLYAVGGEGPFSEHDDIEVLIPNSLVAPLRLRVFTKKIQKKIQFFF